MIEHFVVPTPTARNFALTSYLMVIPAWIVLRFFYLPVVGTPDQSVDGTYFDVAVMLQMTHATISILIAGLGYTARRNSAYPIVAACTALVVGAGFYLYAESLVGAAAYDHMRRMF